MLFLALYVLGFWWFSLFLNAIASLNGKINFLDALLWMVLGLVIIIVVEFVAIVVCRFLPNKMYRYKAKFYKIAPWQNTCFQKIAVHKWKNWLPEFGLYGFRKDKLINLRPAYLERFVKETCIVEVTHWVAAVLSVLVLFIPAAYFGTTAFPYWLGSVLFNLMVVVTQRYTRGRLRPALKRAQKLEKGETPAN